MFISFFITELVLLEELDRPLLQMNTTNLASLAYRKYSLLCTCCHTCMMFVDNLNVQVSGGSV